MTNSKKAYFEEILAMLKVIIALIAYFVGLKYIAAIFSVWAIFDFYCAIKYALKSVINIKKETL